MTTGTKRKRRWHVPGVHDFIPPEGRLTFILTDERGREKHRTWAENSIAPHFRNALSTACRGQGNTTAVGFDQWGSQVIGLDTDDVTNAVVSNPTSTAPRCYAQHRQFQRSLYLSNDATVDDSQWWYPLGLYGGAQLDAPYTGTHAFRGQLVLTQCQRRWDGCRYAADFGLDVANGVQLCSAGLAGLTFSPDVYGHTFGWDTMNTYLHSSNSGYPGGSAIAQSMCNQPGSQTAYWMLSSGMAGTNGISKQDIAVNTGWNTTSVRTITGPTLATLGNPNTNQAGIAIIGTDFWLMDTLRLRKSVIPVDGTYTATATYSPVSGFTDAACLGLAADNSTLYALGATKVFVISPTTGVVTSSWSHNMTNVVGLYYDALMQVLWICGQPPEVTAFRPDQVNSYNDVVHNAGAPIARPWQPFTVAGVRKGTGGMQPIGSSNGGTSPKSMVLLDNGNHRITGMTIPSTAYVNFSQAMTNGGCLGTRGIVASPFTKTAVNAMRIVYEIIFPTG